MVRGAAYFQYLIGLDERVLTWDESRQRPGCAGMASLREKSRLTAPCSPALKRAATRGSGGYTGLHRDSDRQRFNHSITRKAPPVAVQFFRTAADVRSEAAFTPADLQPRAQDLFRQYRPFCEPARRSEDRLQDHPAIHDERHQETQRAA